MSILKAIASFVSCLALAFFPSSGIAQNLIVNGGFETATTGMPLGNPLPFYPNTLNSWGAVTVDGEYILDPAYAYSGSGFLSVLQNTGANPATPWLGSGSAGGYDRAFQTVAISPSTQYQLGLWYRSGDDHRYAGYGAGDVFIQVEQLAPANALITTQSLPATTVWQHTTLTFTTSATASSIIVMFSAVAVGGSDVWVDDVELIIPCDIDLGNDTTLCPFETLLLDATTIGAPSYLWQDGSTGPSFMVGASGSYWVEVTTGGCVARDTVNVAFNSPASIALGNDTMLCTGATLLLDATLPSAISYLWQDGSTNPTFSVHAGGIYWVEVSTATCSSRDTIDVSYFPPISVNLGNDTILCPGETLLLDGTTVWPTGYLWQDSSTNPTFPVNAVGVYWIEVSIAGCSTRDSISVSYFPLISVNLGNDTILCPGETLLLDGTTLWPTGYLWQDGSTNPTFQVTAGGVYWLEVSLARCSVRDTINVGYNAPASNQLGNDTILCVGETLLLDATTPSATSYLWQNSSTNATFSVSTGGSYWVEVTTGRCSSADTIVVSYAAPVSVNLGNDSTLCPGETLLLDATTPAAITYLWQDGSTNPTLSVTTSGAYWVEVTTATCSGRDTINVGYNAPASTNLGHDTTLCAGETLVLDATTPSATSYLWQNSSTNATFSVTTGGSYWVEVTTGNCSSADTIAVNYNSPMPVDLGNDTTLCPGETLLLSANIPAATSYLWQDGSGNATFLVTTSGAYWVEVDIGNCTSADTINVNYNAPGLVDLGNDTTLCASETLLLDATTSGATAYLWQDGSTAPAFSVTINGSYWVEVTTGNCSSNDTITVSYTAPPSVSLGIDKTLCTGDAWPLDATTSSATSYLWQDGSTDALFSVTTGGTYWVEVSVGNCSDADTVVMDYHSPVPVHLGNDTTLCPSGTVILNATTPTATYYRWQDSSVASTFTVTQEGIYAVVVITPGNCISTDTVEVQFNTEQCGCIMAIPTAFSPNEDGANDKFRPIKNCDVGEFNLSVFNRWGEKIFETKSPNDFWDGTYQGVEQPLGVYAYVLTYKFSGAGKTETKYGNVTLVK